MVAAARRPVWAEAIRRGVRRRTPLDSDWPATKQLAAITRVSGAGVQEPNLVIGVELDGTF